MPSAWSTSPTRAWEGATRSWCRPPATTVTRCAAASVNVIRASPCRSLLREHHSAPGAARGLAVVTGCDHTIGWRLAGDAGLGKRESRRDGGGRRNSRRRTHMAVTLRRGARERAPEVPSGRIVLQPPPEITPSEGASSLLMNAVPMLGSVGSIAFVALASPGVKGYIAAGMFLLASVGFVGVSGWRQKQQHSAGVSEARREYLSYLAEVRETVREAARRQRRAAQWNYPAPDALPVLCEERSRVWERAVTDEDFLRVRFGRTNQPLCISLAAPETPPMAQLDPVAASALHRLLTTHRIQPDLPAAVSLPFFSRIEVTGEEQPTRGLARSMVSAVAAQHAPDQLVVAVVASEQALPEWEWVKWLPHSQSLRERDGVGQSRLVATSLTDLEPLLPEDLRERPRFGRTDQALLPHVLLVVDGGEVPPGNAIVTEDGVLGVTVLHLP